MLTPGATAAVLGTGIMGSSVALFLARRGVRVVMFDAAARPFDGASRFNEGKIHLGYLYGADPTLATAHALIPGGLAFPRLVRELIDRDLEPLTTPHDDRYIIHRRSVVDLDQAMAVARRVARLVAQHPDAGDYFAPVGRGPRPLSATDLDAEYDTDLVTGGFAVPERSIATRPVADAFVEALVATPGVEVLTHHRVVGVAQADDDRWSVDTSDPGGDVARHGPFPVVVNALWEGRAAIDVTAGLEPPATCTHRYRVSVFGRTASPVDLGSSVVAVGPFGDVKNYDGRHLYLSWYPAGLLVAGEEVAPPPRPELDDGAQADLAGRMIRELGTVIPAVGRLQDAFESCEVRGGWVYAAGTGPLDRVESDLHRRDRIGTRQRGGYVSIDTGKYSIAPWLARRLVDELLT